MDPSPPTLSTPGAAEDSNGIPDDLRCKRSDGKQWRCHAMSMPDKTVCEKHYIQAKKRAANSAMRASIKRSKRRPGESDSYLESKSDDMDSPIRDYPMTASGSKSMEMLSKRQISYSPETPSSFKNSSAHVSSKSYDDLQMAESEGTPMAYMTPSSVADSSKSRTEKMHGASAMAETSDGDSESFENTGGQVCHQCRRDDRHDIVWCLKCDRKGYCDECISTWYPDIPAEEFCNMCPACRGCCNCKTCSRGDNLIKGRIQDIRAQEKLEHLFYLLSSVLPVVKQIHVEQCSELELERKLRGNRIDLPRMKLNADEQMCCDFCRIPIIDYHRHCGTCSYDICLRCCQDVRKASKGDGEAEVIRIQTVERNEDTDTHGMQDKPLTQTMRLSIKLRDWKANADGSVPCPPKEHGGCGNSPLMLKRIFKMNWVAKLVKNADEMISGCIMNDINSLKMDGLSSRLCQYAGRSNGDDNFLYTPTCQDIKSEGISEFRKQWMKGVPVIVREVCDESSMLGWDPMVMQKGIQETTDERMKDDNHIVKAIDCVDRSEIDIELGQFIKGYFEGRMRKDNRLEMLLLKNWPSASASEEFLLNQRSEFINKLPLLEYIHSKWGLLNLAARLPHFSLQNDVGPKILLSYGTHEELGQGDPVTMLHLNMRDVVYLLVHTCEAKTKGLQTIKDLGDSEATKSVTLAPQSLNEAMLPKSPISEQNIKNIGQINMDSVEDDKTESQGISTAMDTTITTTNNPENDGEIKKDSVDDDRTESHGISTPMNTTVSTTTNMENDGEINKELVEDDRTESHEISTNLNTTITTTSNTENDVEINKDLTDEDRTESRGISATMNATITTTNNMESDAEINIDSMEDDTTENQGISTTMNSTITITNNTENDAEINIDSMEDDTTESQGIGTTMNTTITTTSNAENDEINIDSMEEDRAENQGVSTTMDDNITTTNNMKIDGEVNRDSKEDDDRTESHGINTTTGNTITTTNDEKALKCEDLNKTCEETFDKSRPGAIWDIFRREDVPNLIEYMRLHSTEFGIPENIINDSVPGPLHEGTIFLDSHHKRKLKDEYGIEPWSIEQHLGVAIFIPTGCPFQVRNLQSSVQLGLDFLFPESLTEAVRLAGEIRELPNDHDAKLQVLEAGKISLYAASSSIKEVQKLVLDPKLGAELPFEDPNLTESVSMNLQKMTKQRKVACA